MHGSLTYRHRHCICEWVPKCGFPRLSIEKPCAKARTTASGGGPVEQRTCLASNPVDPLPKETCDPSREASPWIGKDSYALKHSLRKDRGGGVGEVKI